MREKFLLLLLTLAPVFLFNSCKKDPVDDNPTKISVLIDTDLDVDDAMGIMYLLQHPEMSVEGISISGTGMSYPIPATKNALGLIDLAGQPNIPVATGDTIAINSNNTQFRPVAWITEANAMMGFELPVNPNPPVDMGAVDFIIDFLIHAENPVRIVVFGPMTNLGRALIQSPNIASKIEMVFIMGGAVNVAGNLQDGGITTNPFAEWNIFLDPHAADIVFKSGVNITLVPLDATTKAPVTNEFLNRFSNDRNTPEADFVFAIISKLKDELGDMDFWDPLAAVISSDQSIANITTYPVTVITAEGNENGRTKVDSVAGNSVNVCFDTDMNNFENVFLDVLNGRMEKK